MYKMDKVFCSLIGRNGFDLKLENERFTAAESRCRESFNFGNFQVVVLQTTSKK